MCFTKLLFKKLISPLATSLPTFNMFTRGQHQLLLFHRAAALSPCCPAAARAQTNRAGAQAAVVVVVLD